MAGIGFALKKMFQKDTFSNRALAYLYSSFIAAGPWILSVISINFLLVIMRIINVNNVERNLFSATIVYSFLFSQLLVAPVQLIITRYISDQLYQKKYDMIKPTFLGINKIIFFLSIIICLAFYWNKPLPLLYKILSSYLFVIISEIWVILIFLSAVKNYKLIAKAYLFGGILTVALIFYLVENPIYFEQLQSSTNFLISYVLGVTLILIFFLFNFFSTFYYGKAYKYDFIRYFGKFASLGLIGLFYTSGLWVDNVILWFSDFQVVIYDTFIFAPFYDNALFLSYLTTIPSLVLFLVIIETEFFIFYKHYFGYANSAHPLEVIEKSKREMRESLLYNLTYTFMAQLLISITLVLLANPIFKLLQINYLIRDIFKVTTIGASFNIFTFILILVLLYFEKRGKALSIAFIFFVLNGSLTYYFTTKPIEYTGYGFAIAAFISFLIAVSFLRDYLKNINYSTFALQPIYLKEKSDIFVKFALKMNSRVSEK